MPKGIWLIALTLISFLTGCGTNIESESDLNSNEPLLTVEFSGGPTITGNAIAVNAYAVETGHEPFVEFSLSATDKEGQIYWLTLNHLLTASHFEQNLSFSFIEPNGSSNAGIDKGAQTMYLVNDGEASVVIKEDSKISGTFSLTLISEQSLQDKQVAGSFNGIFTLSCFIASSQTGTSSSATGIELEVDTKFDTPFCKAIAQSLKLI